MGLHKKLTALFLIACMAGSMCACSAAKDNTSQSDESRFSDQGGMITETTESESGSGLSAIEETSAEETSAEQTTAAETTVSETTAAETTAVKAEIKVSDAVKKKFKVEGTPVVFRYPKISISTVSTKSVNSKIKKDLKKYNNRLWRSDYTYHIGKDLVSIFITLEGPIGDSYSYFVYNISIATGKLMDSKEVLKACGVTEKEFLSMVKSTYKKFGAGPGGMSGSINNTYYKKNAKKASLKYVKPFINKKGQLCFVGYVYYEGGAGEGYQSFNAEKKKQFWL